MIKVTTISRSRGGIGGGGGRGGRGALAGIGNASSNDLSGEEEDSNNSLLSNQQQQTYSKRMGETNDDFERACQLS